MCTVFMGHINGETWSIPCENEPQTRSWNLRLPFLGIYPPVTIRCAYASQGPPSMVEINFIVLSTPKPETSLKVRPSAMVSTIDRMKELPVIFIKEARPGSVPSDKLVPADQQ